MLGNMQFGVKALIEQGDSEFLFLRRAHPVHGEIEPGWDIPGGRVITDKKTKIRENLVTALYREIYEETEIIDLGILRVAGFQKFTIEDLWLNVERTYFLGQYMPGQELLLEPKEHIELRWATIEQALGGLQLNPMLREFLDVYSGNVSGVPTRSQIII